MTGAISYTKSLIDITKRIFSYNAFKEDVSFPKLQNMGEKKVNDDFHGSMGCYDGAEIWELVGSFIFNQQGPIIEKNDIGLYRDNGLWIFRGISKPMAEKKKKLTVKTFKQCGLAISVWCNLKTDNFLNITFDL